MVTGDDVIPMFKLLNNSMRYMVQESCGIGFLLYLRNKIRDGLMRIS